KHTQGQKIVEKVDIKSPVIQKLLKDQRIQVSDGLKLFILPDCKTYYVRKKDQWDYSFNINVVFVNVSNQKIEILTSPLLANRISSYNSFLLFLKKNNLPLLTRFYYNHLYKTDSNTDTLKKIIKGDYFSLMGKKNGLQKTELFKLNPNSAIGFRIDIFSNLYGFQYSVIEDKSKLNDSVFVFLNGVPEMKSIFQENQPAIYKLKLYFDNTEQLSFIENFDLIDVFSSEKQRKYYEIENLKRLERLKKVWRGVLESNEIDIRTVLSPTIQ
ncbi:MAG: hypothetical protein AB7I41_25035, partial [Candidatus Sericytochromatia bacterium]